MADNDGSKLRYDDFVGNVQLDPAKPVSTIMLSGFVGHGPEGHARIYPDPTLGTWYDVPEDDVVHNMPIPDSKLGGSYVWVKASAQIKPGTTAAAPAAVAPQAHAAGIPHTIGFECQAPAAAAQRQAMDSPFMCSAFNCDRTKYLCPTEAYFCSWWNCPVAAAPAAAMAGLPAAQAGAQPLTMHLSWCICDPQVFAPCSTGPPPRGWTHNGTVCTIPSLVACTTITTIFTTPGMAAGAPAGMGTGVFNPMLAAGAAPATAAAGCLTAVLCAPNGVFTPYGR